MQISRGACRGHTEVLNSKKMALVKLLDSGVQGALVRSPVQNDSEMDALSGYFLGLEKKKKQASLVLNTKLELTEPQEIRGRATELFTELYSPEFKEDVQLGEDFEELYHKC